MQVLHDYKKMRQGPDGQWAHISIPSHCSQSGPDLAGTRAYAVETEYVIRGTDIPSPTPDNL